MLLILFAGHDTTGHTMTWLLFELCRNPAFQLELQAEVDNFFKMLDGRDPTYQELSELDFMNRCITETLRMWPAVANGTYRQLHFDDTMRGAAGQEITLPAGTSVQIMNWSRHRNPDLWGPDADCFNPRRKFLYRELARVGGANAAENPQSHRFSPFTHNPRSCLGKNFAQLEMRLIILYLLRDFSFSLSPAYQRLMNRTCGAAPAPEEFRGVNRGTMGPMDLEHSTEHGWGTRPLYALKLLPRPRRPLN
jgi:cytochrome P450